MTSRITVVPYPKEETYTLEEFLTAFDIKIELKESRTGNWYCMLVGATVPEMAPRYGSHLRPATAMLGRYGGVCPTQNGALVTAAETLTLLHRLQRVDGTDIDIRNIRVVP